jgi:hypothetical protein
MSVKATVFVWKLELEPATKLVFLAVADHAGIDGENAHPSVRRLVGMTGYSERQVQRALKELRDRGLIVPDTMKVGRGQVPTYRVALEKGDEVAPIPVEKGRQADALSDDQKGDEVTPIAGEKDDAQSPILEERVTPVSQKGDIHDGTIKGVKNRHEPSELNAPQPPVRLLPRPAGAPPIDESASEAARRHEVYGAYCRGVGIKPDTAEYLTRWHQAWPHLSAEVLEVMTPERMQDVASFVSMRRKADGILHPPAVEWVLMAESEFDAWDDAGRPETWSTRRNDKSDSRTPAGGLDIAKYRELAASRAGRS